MNIFAVDCGLAGYDNELGVVVDEDLVLSSTPDEIASSVRLACEISVACAGRGSILGSYEILGPNYQWPKGSPMTAINGWWTVEQFWENVSWCERYLVTKDARKGILKLRRREFDAVRHDLILKLLDTGILFECSVTGCDTGGKITVDHKTPISRGGTDDVENLQFMCSTHNSRKGAALLTSSVD